MRKLMVDVATIRIGARLRPDLDMAVVAKLVESIKRMGLQNPISVKLVDDYEDEDGELWSQIPVLVAGRHRLEALRQLNAGRVECIIFEDHDKARLWEISENLHRADLTILERDEHVAEWIRLTDAMQVSAPDLNKPAQLAQVSKGGRGKEGGLSAAARELSVDRDAARRAVKVAAIAEPAKQAARDAGLADNQQALLQIAKLAAAKAPAADQVAEVAEIAAQKEAARLAAEAKRQAAREAGIKPAKPTPCDLVVAAYDALTADGKLEFHLRCPDPTAASAPPVAPSSHNAPPDCVPEFLLNASTRAAA